jgi:hypothetical protein
MPMPMSKNDLAKYANKICAHLRVSQEEVKKYWTVPDTGIDHIRERAALALTQQSIDAALELLVDAVLFFDNPQGSKLL